MVKNQLLTSIKVALNELLLSFLNGGLKETDLLKTLNESVHYNKSYQPYIYEMFFIQALELDKIPNSSTFINMLFKNCGTDDYLHPESYNQDGTRMKVLKKLGLKKTIKLYELFLIKDNPESHIEFKLGVKDSKYIEAQKSDIVFEMIRKMITKELNEND